MNPQADRTNQASQLTVLILTAAVAGGHVASGRALQAELEDAGHRVVVTDGLRPMSWLMEWYLRQGYALLLRYAAWVLRPLFVVSIMRPFAAIIRFCVSRVCADRLLALIEPIQPDLVVSTYPMVTAALGHLRQRGDLRAPAVALITDYGAHRLWVAPGMDLHLVACRRSAELVRRAGGNVQIARLPLAPSFREPVSRQAARERLSLPANARIALIVGGAWGIGDVEGAADCAVAAGWYPVVVTGNNVVLQSRLQRKIGDRQQGRILGWTQEMPCLMAAADCLIQNAGGMTCLEAVSQGLPILLYRPIPGHGELNAKVMVEAGAARLMHGRQELRAVLQAAADGETELLSPSDERGCSTVAALLATHARPSTTAFSPRSGPRPTRVSPRRVLISLAAIVLLCWLAVSPWSLSAAAEQGWLPVVGANRQSGMVAVVARATDPTTARELEDVIVQDGLPVALIVDAHGAEGLYSTPGLVVGVAEDQRGEGAAIPWRVRHRMQQTATVLRRRTGISPRYFLPMHGELDVVDLAVAPRHTRLVDVQRHGSVVVVNTAGLTPEAATQQLEQKLASLQAQGLHCIPLAALSSRHD